MRNWHRVKAQSMSLVTAGRDYLLFTSSCPHTFKQFNTSVLNSDFNLGCPHYHLPQSSRAHLAGVRQTDKRLLVTQGPPPLGSSPSHGVKLLDLFYSYSWGRPRDHWRKGLTEAHLPPCFSARRTIPECGVLNAQLGLAFHSYHSTAFTKHKVCRNQEPRRSNYTHKFNNDPNLLGCRDSHDLFFYAELSHSFPDNPKLVFGWR